ncbi:cytochrome c-like protein [Flavobacterium enshiense DK69]|uniref:Cytochrome C n=1 Tax=Flavobacterium enshiense DK69 TaxID=1107311 RepID=V6SHC3_9FLAO|nr:c-type cytochrome [Flavobacterium enshiense]ESU23805.1 cytochrome c-like protein [Flavobacterium enshiense DK69]KGO96065.1 cytochrome C [Flavobacterium enshiense DK69]
MSVLKKVLLGFALLLIVVVFSAMLYMKMALPDVGDAPAMKVVATPEKIERGRYLANHVTICIDCHSKRDWSKFSGPIVPGSIGMGGELFDQKFGFPGSYYSKNITPSGISDYTDGELYRAITTGVNKKGEAMFPVMPFHNYGKLDPEDVKAIIAYVRTLAPIENKIPESSSDFPMNFIINTIPQKAKPSKIPDPSNTLAYGNYLATAASCVDCHTQFEKGEFVAGMEFAGGREFPFPDGSVVRSANITPHASGMGQWSKESFIAMFKAREDISKNPAGIKPGEYNSIMPWTMFAGMKNEDLAAIYDYLKTLKPIDNKVEKFTKGG